MGLTGAALPGRGSVAIVTKVGTAGERIVLHDEGRAEWVRLGLEVVLNYSPIHTAEEATSTDAEASPAACCYDVPVRVLGDVEVEGVDEHLTDADSSVAPRHFRAHSTNNYEPL